MAERGGFEPPVELLTLQRFSKPPPSATRPSLRLSRIIPEAGLQPHRNQRTRTNGLVAINEQPTNRHQRKTIFARHHFSLRITDDHCYSHIYAPVQAIGPAKASDHSAHRGYVFHGLRRPVRN
uniref:Uncharacterized protein n=1 Tax=mine drainage metagenome TaxID=410659 RepID=E6QLM2_9ZZZZ